MPRGGGGSDGVVVNIFNNTGGDSEVATSSRQGPSGEQIVDVMVEKSMRRSLNNGALDDSFSSAFSLSRVPIRR